jgi:hypothetical protein
MAAATKRALAQGRTRSRRWHSPLMRGRKLVVQLVETFSEKMVPVFVEKLDSLELAEKLKLDLAPVMIYGDDVTHIVSEEGIANLLLCRTAEEREQAIRGIAGFTDVGRGRDRKMVEKLRERKIIRRPEDLGINPLDAHRSMLAARSIEGSDALVRQSVRPAQQVPQLVGGANHADPEVQAHSQAPPVRQESKMRSSAWSRQAIWKCCWNACFRSGVRGRHRHAAHRLRRDLEGGGRRIRRTLFARRLAHLDQ